MYSRSPTEYFSWANAKKLWKDLIHPINNRKGKDQKHQPCSPDLSPQPVYFRRDCTFDKVTSGEEVGRSLFPITRREQLRYIKSSILSLEDSNSSIIRISHQNPLALRVWRAYLPEQLVHLREEPRANDGWMREYTIFLCPHLAFHRKQRLANWYHATAYKVQVIHDPLCKQGKTLVNLMYERTTSPVCCENWQTYLLAQLTHFFPNGIKEEHLPDVCHIILQWKYVDFQLSNPGRGVLMPPLQFKEVIEARPENKEETNKKAWDAWEQDIGVLSMTLRITITRLPKRNAKLSFNLRMNGNVDKSLKDEGMIVKLTTKKKEVPGHVTALMKIVRNSRGNRTEHFELRTLPYK